jgi:hypothetical protein
MLIMLQLKAFDIYKLTCGFSKNLPNITEFKFQGFYLLVKIMFMSKFVG